MFTESRTEFLLRWYSYRWRKKNPYRLAELAFYKAIACAPRDGVFLDLGANVGLITSKAVELGKQVIAFEPDPKALRSLRHRFASDPNVQIIPKAVGATPRIARFYRRPDEWTEASSLNWTKPHEGGEVIEVEVVDLVEFIQALDRPVTAIKMDIEGAEAECLEAILDAGLHHSIGSILVETHEDFSPEIAARIDAIRNRIRAENIRNINLDWV